MTILRPPSSSPQRTAGRALSALLLLPTVAAACQYEYRADARIFNQAKAVFRARITAVALATDGEQDAGGASPKATLVEGRFELGEVYKGTPPISGLVRDLPYGFGNCSLGLVPGWEYVFFLGDGDLVSLPSGSFSFTHPDAPDIRDKLERLGEFARRHP